MHPTLFKIGNFELRFYGLMYAMAFFVGLYLLKKDANKRGIDVKIMEDYAFWAMISGLLGGRLYYVMFNLKYYLKHILEIPAVWHGGMAIHGGIIGGLLGTYLFAKKKNLSMWTLLDMIVAPGLLGQTLGRFGNFMNGEVHGVPTFTPLKVIISNKFATWWEYYQVLGIEGKSKFKELVPWGLVFPLSSPAGREFPRTPVHPAMLYELVLNFIGFLLLWFYYRKKNLEKGSLFFIYLITYSIIRVFVSTFRAEDLLVFGIRAPYLISIVLVAWSVVMLKKLNKKKDTV